MEVVAFFIYIINYTVFGKAIVWDKLSETHWVIVYVHVLLLEKNVNFLVVFLINIKN